MKTIFFLTALAVGAQTTTKINQHKGTPGAVDRLIIIAADGTYRQVELGPGLAVDEGKLTITTVPTTPPEIIASLVQIRLPRDADGNYPAVQGIAVIYARNGLLQTAGEDYTVTSGRVIPNIPWPAEDIISAIFVTAKRVTPAP